MNAAGVLSTLRLLSPSPERGISRLNVWNPVLDIPSIPLLAERKSPPKSYIAPDNFSFLFAGGAFNTETWSIVMDIVFPMRVEDLYWTRNSRCVGSVSWSFQTGPRF